MGVLGIGSLDRVAHQDEQPHPGQVAVDALGDQRMKHLVRAAFEGDRLNPGTPDGYPGPGPDRELALVPGEPAVVFVVEEVQFLLTADGGKYGRMLAQHVEHGGGAAALGAGDRNPGSIGLGESAG